MGALRVAVTQFELRAEPDFTSFAAHVADVVRRAATAGANLLVLPELATTGLLASRADAERLTVDDMSDAYQTLFPEMTVEWCEELRKLSAESGMTILGGSHYRQAADGTFRNTAFLAHPDGRVDEQDKLHLTPQEKAMGATPGESVLITCVDEFRVGVQICADVEFPEVSRHLAAEGAQLLLCPSLTWNRRGATRVRYSAHARALENQLFVAVSPLIGTSGIPCGRAMHGTGRAMVACPIDRIFGRNDGVLAEASVAGEEVVTVDLDMDLIEASRAAPEPPGLANTRPDLYEQLTSLSGNR
jgi:predicted amidohydrolase